jgi:uncharacterized protein (TIGR03086 family)
VVAELTPDSLARAFASTRLIVGAVTPEQLDAPTPCVSWRVRDIINHLIAGSYWFAGAMSTGVAPPFGDDDYCASDYLAAYDQGIRLALAAFRAPGALDQTLTLHFGPMEARGFLLLATDDVFAHGWDIARALDMSTDLDPELADQLLPHVMAWIQPAHRGGDTEMPFGPMQPVRADAPPADQLAAFLGRTVTPSRARG